MSSLAFSLSFACCSCFSAVYPQCGFYWSSPSVLPTILLCLCSSAALSSAREALSCIEYAHDDLLSDTRAVVERLRMNVAVWAAKGIYRVTPPSFIDCFSPANVFRMQCFYVDSMHHFLLFSSLIFLLSNPPLNLCTASHMFPPTDSLASPAPRALRSALRAPPPPPPPPQQTIISMSTGEWDTLAESEEDLPSYLRPRVGAKRTRRPIATLSMVCNTEMMYFECQYWTSGVVSFCFRCNNSSALLVFCSLVSCCCWACCL